MSLLTTPTPETFNDTKEEIEFLRAKLATFESNREKLIDQLRMKKIKEKEIFLNLTELDLPFFFEKDKCDKKLLATLYWDQLTEQQKAVFNDRDQVEFEKEYERKQKEIMNDPVKMKQHFLRGAAPILDDMIKMAKGDKRMEHDAYAFKEVWEVLKNIINSANDRAPMINLRGKDVAEQIDTILTKVTAGDITFVEAKEYMSLVSAGFNLQELPKMMAKLEALEGK